MFIETIKIKDNEIFNLDLHQKRMVETSVHYHFKAPLLPDLIQLCPKELLENTVKCRILYRDTIHSIHFEVYVSRMINSLKLVSDNSVNYAFKSNDRSLLLKLLDKKEECDEILIVKNGFITDTSFSNIVLEKNGLFFTPDTPLLNGTKRQYLLIQKKISEKKIAVSDIYNYERVFLINAMLDISDTNGIPCTQIFT